MAKVKIQGHASGSGVLTITAPNTSTDRTITLPDSTGTILDNTSTLDATKLSGNLPAISAASLTNVPKDVTVGGRKNMLYNGGMRVAQRGTSFSNTTDSQYLTDRWASAIGSGFNLDTTITQSATVPSGEGFKYSLKVEADSVVTPSGSDNGGVMQILEKCDVESLGYGTSSAKSLTLSFWTRSNKTGTYCVALMQNMGNLSGSSRYAHIKEYTISSANTWEKKTITFSGNTAQALDASSSENTDGLRIVWWLATGSSDHNTGDTWYATPSFGSTSNQVNFMDSASNEWYLTGCQLELGSTATDFEHRSYGEELALCQRYYEILGSKAVTDYGFMYIGTNWTTVNSRYGLQWTVTKRASPTITESGTWYCRNSSGSSLSVTAKTFDQPSPYGAAPYVTVASGLSVGHAAQIWGDDGQIYVDAEV